MNWPIKIKPKETDSTINYWIDYNMRKENPIEADIILLWNASIHFICLSREEGKMPSARSISTYIIIICWMLLVFIWARAAKMSNGVSVEKIQRFVMVWSN